MAARAFGLDAGPMSGFDNARVDAAFFAASGWKSNFLVNLGHGDESGLFPRSPRLSFDEAARLEWPGAPRRRGAPAYCAATAPAPRPAGSRRPRSAAAAELVGSGSIFCRRR